MNVSSFIKTTVRSAATQAVAGLIVTAVTKAVTKPKKSDDLIHISASDLLQAVNKK